MKTIKLFILVLVLVVNTLAQNYSSRNELIAEYRMQSRMTTDTNAINDYRLIRFVNRAVMAVDDKLRPNQSFDTIWTTAGTATYALNSDCYLNGIASARILTDSTNGKYDALRRINNKDLNQILPDDYAAAKSPQWFYTYGTKMTLDPTPLKVYRVEIEYEARSPVYRDTGAGADTLLAIKPEYEQLVIDYMKYLVFSYLHLDQEAQAVKQEWINDIAIERQLLNRQPDPLVSPQKERGQ